ncbi:MULTISPECIES: DinB family protein [Saccharibacillus]|uniref:DinB family protein n=1 Tax=Saccharibacillus TaxID=456492 RepID=UPI00123BC59F|nr:DinB family protein [Saccharibacillus sp. WB 17]MWJ31409.1 damage-inducible protein DinB [Saccharibacillus sp. WB 17]
MSIIRDLFRHLDWANQTMLDTLRQQEVGGKPLILFSHLLHAERVWLARLEGTDSSRFAIWSDVEMSYCAELMERNARDFAALLDDPAASDPARVVAYANSRGTTFTNTVGDILTHVALHGQYHRGQINARLREDGHNPVNVDYITFRR